VRQRAYRSDFLKHITPLTSWKHVLDTFRAKYPPPKEVATVASSSAKISGQKGNSWAGSGRGVGPSAATKGADKAAEKPVTPILTRMRAEAAADFFAELKSIAATEQELIHELYLSATALGNIDTALYVRFFLLAVAHVHSLKL
jgi:hypothetical protein